MATLSSLQTQVYERLGVPTTDGRFDATTVTDFINDALREMATEADWPWLHASETLSTVAGQSYVTPGESTTAWTGTRYVTITVGTDTLPLLRRTFDELLDGYTSGQTGQPEAWAVEKERIELRPIPDGVYSIGHGYVRSEKVLSGGTDAPLLPDAYSAACADLAVAIALVRSREDSRAVAAQAAYSRWVAKMLDNRRRTRRPGRIRVRPGSWL